ncbi:MAG: heavy-metal-associated domain-containing protein [Anaerolineae bacterium]|nr:heavy-metal-associated domain-containing protein [Anaerolineae bacterium]
MIKLFGKKGKGNQVELTVRGMTCGHCEMRVANALKAVPGVVDAQADRQREIAIVDLDANQAVSVEALVAAVKAAGYDAEPPG